MGTPTADQTLEKPKTDEVESKSNLVNGDVDLEDNVTLIKLPVGRLVGSVPVDESQEWKDKSLNLGSKFRILKRTDQIWEFQTVIRDVATSRSTFKFVADRLIRTTIEEGLNQLPYTEYEVTTPTGCTYKGLKYQKGNCGVSIVRSGEAMEKALQDCCRSMRIGKILVDSDAETHEAKVIFAKFPTDIAERKVLLLYPIMRTGNKVCRAMQVLIDNNVPEDHVILINLFCTPKAAKRIVETFPNLNVLTSELHEVTPNHFDNKRSLCTMKRAEWHTLKADIKHETPKQRVNDKNFVYQFVGAHLHTKESLYQQSKNGISSTSLQRNDEDKNTTGYKFILTNLVVMYEEQITEEKVMEMCKRLNPSIEVPEVKDLVQQLELMLHSDTTVRTVLFKNNLNADSEQLSQETCTILLDGELAGCEFKWEFTPSRTDPISFFNAVTEPMIGCLTILLRNQSRLVQLLEAKDQEIQDYTLNGAVLSRKSLQTTIFDSQKEALLLPTDFTRANTLDTLRSPEYSQALRVLNASDDIKDIFVAPLAPTGSKTDLNQCINSIPDTARKRSYLPNSTASVMKGPKPLQASQKSTQSKSTEHSNEVPQKQSEEELINQSQPDNCSSPQIKRTRSTRRSANASKNLLKKC